MKTLVTIILVLACAGLIIALVTMQKQNDVQKKKDTETILDLSNQVVSANGELIDLRQVNLALTNDLNVSHQQLLVLSNQFTATSDSLSNSEAQLKTAQDQITALEAQNQALDQHLADLTNTIENLDSQITETQTKLVESETNNVFLQNELKRQVAEKEQLQSKFNDLSTVRHQVKKLHDELVMTRRLEWIREGTEPSVQMKGGERLMWRPAIPKQILPPSRYNLNVEVGANGSVRIVPTLRTNAPDVTNSPPQ
jgi:predicted RNase H-like nuclease (RuvC/YqgF family)